MGVPWYHDLGRLRLYQGKDRAVGCQAGEALQQAKVRTADNDWKYCAREVAILYGIGLYSVRTSSHDRPGAQIPSSSV